jgi:hypothetical protein
MRHSVIKRDASSESVTAATVAAAAAFVLLGHSFSFFHVAQFTPLKPIHVTPTVSIFPSRVECNKLENFKTQECGNSNRSTSTYALRHFYYFFNEKSFIIIFFLVLV